MYREIFRFNPEKMWRIAGQVIDYSLDIQAGDKLLIIYNPGARQLVEMVGAQAAGKGAIVLTRSYDTSVLAAVFAAMDEGENLEEKFETMIEPRWAEIKWANKYLEIVSDDTPKAYEIVDRSLYSRFRKVYQKLQDYRVRELAWNIISIPTSQEAEIDGEEYGQYIDTFLEACDRNWSEVEKAQNTLVNILRGGKRLEFFADRGNPDKNWRTKLSMSIEGMVFGNETANLNFPGSEIFSAPVRGTVEGQLALPYRVRFANRILPNLRLVFKKGKVVEYSTDGDKQWVEKMLNTDEGAREIGEIAFGTNPAFKKPYLNPMFVEKVGGSFHLAVGAAYPFKEYASRPVRVDNGVRSALHEDLTRMMLPEYGGGEVILDGKTIQKDGRFLDPQLEILNPKHK